MTTRRELHEMLETEAGVEVGKVVYLLSGSPGMTVRSIKGKRVNCEWFDKSGRLRSHEFLVSSLTGTPRDKDGRPRGILVIGNLDDDLHEVDEKN